MLGNQHCEGGCSNLASIYCDCIGRKVFLCDACFPNHRMKSPHLVHRTVGVEVTTPSDVYQQRCADFVKRKAELQVFLSKLDACTVEFGRAADDLLKMVQTYRESQLTQLGQWRKQIASDIDYCILEVEGSLNQDKPALQGTYSPFLRGSPADCPLYFDFKIDTSSLYPNVQTLLRTLWQKPIPNPPPTQRPQPAAYYTPPILTDLVQSQVLTPFSGPQPAASRSNSSTATQSTSGLYQTVQPQQTPGLYQTVQPQQTPGLYQTVQPQQTPGLYQTVQPQYTPFLFSCESCKKAFTTASFGRYCSFGCQQQASALLPRMPILQRPAKKCEFCSNLVITLLTDLPDELEYLRSFAASVCSVKCLGEFEHGTIIQKSCVGCIVKVASNDAFAVKLPCGHLFHNNECILIYMQTYSKGFTVQISSCVCPKCKAAFSRSDVSQYISDLEWSEWQRNVQKSRCCVCGEPALGKKVLGCGHIVCEIHKHGSGQMCCYCNSYQPFR